MRFSLHYIYIFLYLEHSIQSKGFLHLLEEKTLRGATEFFEFLFFNVAIRTQRGADGARTSGTYATRNVFLHENGKHNRTFLYECTQIPQFSSRST